MVRGRRNKDVVEILDSAKRVNLAYFFDECNEPGSSESLIHIEGPGKTESSTKTYPKDQTRDPYN